jgi:hypothetical protein
MTTMREVLEEAMKEGRRWRDLEFSAMYLLNEIQKGRVLEKTVVEKLLTVIPDGPHGRLIRRSFLETKDFYQELDALAYTAQAMADAMHQIAPFPN